MINKNYACCLGCLVIILYVLFVTSRYKEPFISDMVKIPIVNEIMEDVEKNMNSFKNKNIRKIKKNAEQYMNILQSGYRRYKRSK